VKKGSEATYMKLLRIFVTAGHSKCAEVLCEVLKGRSTALTQGMDGLLPMSMRDTIKLVWFLPLPGLGPYYNARKIGLATYCVFAVHEPCGTPTHTRSCFTCTSPKWKVNCSDQEYIMLKQRSIVPQEYRNKN
jgi:hypothetical protein